VFMVMLLRWSELFRQVTLRLGYKFLFVGFND
jgi:hypothetical protein